jgi:hypothetical protein
MLPFKFPPSALQSSSNPPPVSLTAPQSSRARLTTSQSWTRLIRFLAYEDAQVHLGEPVDPDLDVGAAFAEGNRIEAWVLDAEVPWDPRAVRTGEIRTVREVSAERRGDAAATWRCGLRT